MQNSQLNGRQVLVVETDTDVRVLLCELLQDWGARVQPARSLEEALLALRGTPVEVVISDAQTWFARGAELAAAVADLGNGATVLVTGEWPPESAAPSGIWHLPKPFTPSVLRESLSAALSRDREGAP